jgi:hypothetical protein
MSQFPDSVQVVDSAGNVILSLDEKANVHIAGVRAGGHGYNGEAGAHSISGERRMRAKKCSRRRR